MKTSSIPQPRPGDTAAELPMAWLRPLLIGAGALMGAGLILTLWFALAQPVKVLPRIRTMPAFLLTDQAGKPAGDAELRGRMLLLGFSYTRCGAGCAELNGRLQDVRAALAQAGRLGGQISFATISLDPSYDTPAVLRAYAAQIGADPAIWTFLTGAPEEIKGLAGGELGIYYERPDAAGRMVHDQELLLVDEKGILRARYTPKDLTMDRLGRDLGLLDQERNSSGVMRQVYEVSHLFLCYPD
jgi:protein SCO1/2